MLADAAEQRRAQGPPAARQALPRRPRARAHRRRRRGQARDRLRAGPTASWFARAHRPPRRPARARAAVPRDRAAARRASSRSATRRRTCACCSRRWRATRRGADRLDGQRRSRSRCCPTSAPPLFAYFKQLFAQVTNPPIDPIREAIVMSLRDRRRRRGQPARRDARARPPARRCASRSCATASSRSCARSTTTSSARTRSTSPGRSRTAPRAWRARSSAICDEAARGDRARRRTSSSSPTAASAPRRVADPVAAGRRGRAPPPGPRGHAPAGRPRARVRRAARGPPLRHPDRLRRQRGQPYLMLETLDELRRRRAALPGGRRTPSEAERRDSSRRSARAC